MFNILLNKYKMTQNVNIKKLDIINIFFYTF